LREGEREGRVGKQRMKGAREGGQGGRKAERKG